MPTNSINSSVSKGTEYTGKLKIHLNTCHLDVKVSRPYVIITMGDQIYQTSISEYPDGKWNEGFELKVTYHAQLFDTIQLDVYDSYMLLPDRHVGRAEIRLVQLDGMPEIFTSFYEIWDKKLSSGASSHAVRKTTMSTNVGAIQAKITYQFQKFSLSSSMEEDDRLLLSRSSMEQEDSNADFTNGLVSTMGNDGSADAITFRRHLQRDRDASAIRFRKYEEGAENNNDSNNQQQVSSDNGRKLDAPQPASPLENEDLPDNSESDSDSNYSSTLAYSVRRANSKLHTTGPSSSQQTQGKGTMLDSFSSWFGMSSSPYPVQHPPTSTPISNTSNTPINHYPPTVSITSDNQDAKKQQQQQQRTTENLSNMDILNDLDDSLKTFPLLDTIGSWTVSKETNQILRAIGKLLAAFGQGFELSHLQILTGFAVVEKFYQELPRERTWDLVTDLSEIQLASHMWRFSMASYGWKGLNFIGKGNGYLSDAVRDHSDARSIMEHLSLPKEDLLAYEFRTGEAFRPSYFVAHDRSTNSIVLSIRGTMSAFDTMTDLVCDYEPWKGGMVHKGMKASAMWFFHHLGPKLIAYSNAQSTTALYIVGHSLGAATASILTIMLLDYMDELKKGKTDDFTLQCFGFAPACCLSLDLSEKYKDHIQSIVFADDVVSKLCYGTMMDVKQMIIAGSEAAQHLGIGQLLWTDELGKQKWKEAFKQVAECRQRCIESLENPRVCEKELLVYGIFIYLYVLLVFFFLALCCRNSVPILAGSYTQK
ncbi:hypothetical protein BCR42DRAFT_404639 [Absidia repens]|uniref:sn-1-specific diacylglycerol lipase n=1 Tax=Absidia repens TaxID=90262 RepID=A0A1X2IWG1_9FUNG|nr:hypothetical protein BCR42DRAFT_404639 [Absidia repens]